MKILAIDTTSAICGVALLEDENLIDDNSLDNGLTHSENLMPLIKEILQRNNLSLKNIELISCCTGPGSFTGIRIGVATVKALAEVCNIKIASCSSLENLAMNIKDKVQENTVIVSMIDARNNQVYAGIFDNKVNLKEENMANDIDIILNENIKKYSNIVVVGNGSEIHKEKIMNFANENNIEVYFSEENLQTAYATGRMGYKRFLENDLKTADTLLPEYLKKSQAERLKK
jgi:tRNA threonylcarbamoyladenosine biosynthesis protein TsaB